MPKLAWNRLLPNYPDLRLPHWGSMCCCHRQSRKAPHRHSMLPSAARHLASLSSHDHPSTFHIAEKLGLGITRSVEHPHHLHRRS